MSGPNRKHAKADRGLDLYETPVEAVRALLRHEQLPRYCWDPCCGPGNIVATLRMSGRDCYASDIRDYGDLDWVDDFLARKLMPLPAPDAIVMNPPYGKAEAFVARALELTRQVYCLLRLNFIAATRPRNPTLYDRLARVHVFSRRLPMMHRAGWTGPKATNSQDHAWFVWERRPPPEGTRLTRIDWKETGENR